jgi:hypothetical protein
LLTAAGGLLSGRRRSRRRAGGHGGAGGANAEQLQHLPAGDSLFGLAKHSFLREIPFPDRMNKTLSMNEQNFCL